MVSSIKSVTWRVRGVRAVIDGLGNVVCLESPHTIRRIVTRWMSKGMVNDPEDSASMYDYLHLKIGWPTEQQLLLLKAAIGVGEAAATSWRQWRQHNCLDEMDPSSYLITPQLYANLQDREIDDGDLQKLRGIYRYNWTKNQIAMRGLNHVQSLLRQINVQAIVIKGALTLLQSGSDYGARTLNDIDLIVREHEYEISVEQLLNHGWNSPYLSMAYHRHDYHTGLNLQHPRYGDIDLHWRPLSLFSDKSTEDAIWNHAESLHVPFDSLLAPDRYDSLLMIAHHGRKREAHTNLRWAIDFARRTTESQEHFDWDVLVDRTVDAGLTPLMSDVLRFLHDELDVNIPERIIRKLSRNPPSHRELEYYRHTAYGTENLRLLKRLAGHWWRYRIACQRHGSTAGVRDFVRYSFRMRREALAVPHDWQVVRHSIAQRWPWATSSI